jgi:hypothetical protein
MKGATVQPRRAQAVLLPVEVQSAPTPSVATSRASATGAIEVNSTARLRVRGVPDEAALRCEL